MSRPFRWTRMAKNLRTILAEDSIEETKAWMRQMLTDAAKKDGWRDAEFASTLAYNFRLIDEVARRMNHKDLDNE